MLKDRYSPHYLEIDVIRLIIIIHLFIKRKNFIFNTGIKNVGELCKNKSINNLHNEPELNRDDLFIKNEVRFIFG